MRIVDRIDAVYVMLAGWQHGCEIIMSTDVLTQYRAEINSACDGRVTVVEYEEVRGDAPYTKCMGNAIREIKELPAGTLAFAVSDGPCDKHKRAPHERHHQQP